MHLWTQADRPLIGTRQFLAHQAASLALALRMVRRGARGLAQKRDPASLGTGSRAIDKRSRSESRRQTGAVSALEDELDPVALPGTRLASVGTLLREAREASGRDLPRISTALRIRPEHLRAIEAGTYDDLPAPAYAMGFIRSYADHLGLDAAAMVRRFKQESAGNLVSPELTFPEPLGRRRVSLGGALVGLAILAVCGLGAWHEISAHRQDRGVAPALAVAAAPAPAALLAPPTNAAPMPASTTTTAGGATEPLASLSPAAGAPSLPQVRSEAATSHAVEGALVPQSPPAAQPTSTGAGDRHLRLVLHATAECWLEVKDGDTSIFRRLLEPGDEYPLPDKPGLTLHIGNVHGIEVLADGKPLPSAAQPSQSRRTVVTLDSRDLLAKAETP